MQLRTRTWFLLSLLLLLAAWGCWRLGDRRQVGEVKPPGAVPAMQGAAALPPHFQLLATATHAPAAQVMAGAGNGDPKHPYRLSNSRKPVEQLMRSGSAILLNNALIDTSSPEPLGIPDHLKAGDNPGSYIVQSRGPIPPALRSLLQEEGADVISYIPNDALLVRASVARARRIAASPLVQAIVPFAPYFKFSEELLPYAVEQQPIPTSVNTLTALLFPGESEKVSGTIAKLGGTVLGEERSPFGPLLVVRTPGDALTVLAQMPEVQRLEVRHERRAANDLTRVKLGVATDTVVSNNYLNLTGSNVLVNINDTGVDATHPDLAGRVFAVATNTLTDVDGHGTHVAGIIASTGTNSASVTNASGSLTNASFRGKAPAAKLFVLPVDLHTGPLLSDSYLQETAAGTNEPAA